MGGAQGGLQTNKKKGTGALTLTCSYLGNLSKNISWTDGSSMYPFYADFPPPFFLVFLHRTKHLINNRAFGEIIIFYF